jgi:hypothetical protein
LRCGAGLADALLKQGARQDAITAATDVLPALEDGVTSIRCLNRLRLIRQAVASAPGAEEFCARFDTIERALAGPRALPGEVMPDAEAGVPALSRLRYASPATGPDAVRPRPLAGVSYAVPAWVNKCQTR